MKTMTKSVLAFAGALALGLTAVKAQTDGALLDALVKKGVLSDQEAEDIRASAAKDYAQTPAGKLSISDSVSRLTLYGDARLRFEYADEKAQTNLAAGAGKGAGGAGVGAADNIVERNRYRIRVGADYVFTDNFKAGFELESGTNNDSANQTFGNAYGKFAINVGLVYLQWKPTDWLTLTGGKQKNPLYTTDLMWDADINPEGASEVASWTFPVGGSGESFTAGFTALQGIYADNSEFNTKGTDKTDVWQFVEQVPVQFNFNKTTFVKFVPGFDTYMGGGNTGGGPATSNGGGTQNFTANNAANDLAIITAPGEVDWTMWDKPVKFYWDFAANLEGKARVQNEYLGVGTVVPVPGSNQAATQAQNMSLGDNIAWLAGVQVGQNKKKGDWSIKGDFRQVGLGANDPNLQDSDWADSFLNQQGIKVQSQYNFTDFLIGSISVYDSWALKSSLLNGGTPGASPSGLPIVTGTSGTTASGITNLAGVSQTQRVQVDLLWKF